MSARPDFAKLARELHQKIMPLLSTEDLKRIEEALARAFQAGRDYERSNEDSYVLVEEPCNVPGGKNWSMR